MNRYIAMGHYANTLIDSSNDTIYSIFSRLVLLCLLLLANSIALAVLVVKNADKQKRLQATNDTAPR